MVMHENARRGVQAEGAFENLARIDRDVVDGANAHLLIADEPVVLVEKQDVEFLDLAPSERGDAIVAHDLPRGEKRQHGKAAGLDGPRQRYQWGAKF
jgi:hypothetical protein